MKRDWTHTGWLGPIPILFNEETGHMTSRNRFLAFLVPWWLRFEAFLFGLYKFLYPNLYSGEPVVVIRHYRAIPR